MAVEAKNGEALAGLFLVFLLYSCFSGSDEADEAAATPRPTAVVQPAMQATAEQEKQAEDFVKATINLNGFRCAKIIDVKPAGGANLFAVNCILNRNGTGSAVYLYDGDGAKVSRL